jgi:hypothetical protein
MSIPSFLHQTDVFRPPIDPDDHWDLACMYALSQRGLIDLEGILIDYPPEAFPGRSPDIQAVAQLSYLTGRAINVAIGSSRPFSRDKSFIPSLSRRELAGARFVLRYLSNAREKAFITIVGSCRDVAIAAAMEPSLFAEKCAAIYLNAGMGTPDWSGVSETEYNVALNAAAFSAMFDIPCRIYWLPAFEFMVHDYEQRQFATLYRFRQDEILPHLSPELRAYFTYSLEARTHTHFLLPITDTSSDKENFYTNYAVRHMWCTIGFLYAAGHSVGSSGELLPRDHKNAIGGFRPISITCDERGVTTWKDDPASTERYIFEVRNKDAYAKAMVVAMRELLKTI